MSAEVCVISFFLYSFIGWFYESTFCSMMKYKRVINRGFLTGPYCPVYGCGAVMCYLLLHTIENSILLFFAAAVLCSALEYITGYGMEKLFHAKWWDYSDFPCNLHGRICLYGAVLFGVVNVLICKEIQPRFMEVLEKISIEILLIIGIVLCLIFILDIIMTLRNWINFSKHLKNMQELFLDRVNQKYDNISDLYQSKIQPQIIAGKNGIDIWIAEKAMQFKKRELRFLNAFPKLKIEAHEKVIRKIDLRRYIKDVFGK